MGEVVRFAKKYDREGNSIDVGIFINGIPIVMIELKNSLTGQTHLDGIKQWKQDRDPKEPLFRFKRNLVYFSVGTENVGKRGKTKGYLITTSKAAASYINWLTDNWTSPTLIDNKSRDV